MARFRVGGMKCEGCARKVTSAVQRIALGAEVKVDLPAKVVEIASCVEAATITEVIAAAGFPARSID